MQTTHLFAALLSAGAITAPGLASAQIAGASTTVGATITETSQIALGWSARKSILGKTVYNEAGATVGKVEDLIIAPDKNVSYLIVGAGGFVGIGRHDVAVPVSQIRNRSGKLVMAGATQDSVKAMARFEYATDSADRYAFLVQADRDVARARLDITALEKKTAAAGADAKGATEAQMASLRADEKAAEVQLSAMKSAAASRWKEFQADVTGANLRVRKSIDKAMG